jgi:hypothetical protein
MEKWNRKKWQRKKGQGGETAVGQKDKRKTATEETGSRKPSIGNKGSKKKNGKISGIGRRRYVLLGIAYIVTMSLL